MTISFATIPADIRTPGAYLEIDASRAVGGLPPADARLLVIGQRLAAGAVATLQPTRIASAAQAVQAFGRGSMLAQQIAALKLVDDRTECWAIALDDLPAGVAATGTITVTGPATAAGVLALMIQGVRVPVGVAAGDTPATIAAAIVAAIALQPDLIVTAAVAAAPAVGVVTLTCRHKGACGNDVDIRANYYQGEALPTGVGLQIAAMANGAGNPDIAAVWAAIGDTHYSTLLLPFVDAATLGSVEGELVSRWGAMRMIEAMAYGAFRGSFGQAAALGNARDCPYLSILPMRGALAAPWAIAAAYGAAVGFAGAIDPARGMDTLPLPGILAPAQVDRWTAQEGELLLHDGVSTYGVDAGGAVLIRRAITTYQTSALGLPDVTWLDVTTPLTVAYIRQAARARIAAKFPRMKLADDNTAFGPGQPIVTPKIIWSELVALAGDLVDAGIVEDLAQFKAGLVVERDAGDRNRVNALLRPNIVNQFRVFAATIQFLL